MHSFAPITGAPDTVRLPIVGLRANGCATTFEHDRTAAASRGWDFVAGTMSGVGPGFIPLYDKVHTWTKRYSTGSRLRRSCFSSRPRSRSSGW
ncbi:hypothetical protein GCM10027355_00960 [Haloplanus salinarum]